MVYIVLGGALALISFLWFYAAVNARRGARTIDESLARLMGEVSECRRSLQQELTAVAAAVASKAGAREMVGLRTQVRAVADIQQQEFSRLRAVLELLPRSIADLKRQFAEAQEAIGAFQAAESASHGAVRQDLEAARADLLDKLAQIRDALPPPKPSFEDPAPFLEGMDAPDVLRAAQALTFVRPLVPYPNWYFDIDWQNPDLGHRMRRSIWTYFSRRRIAAALDVPWYHGLKLCLRLGNDISRQQYVAGCLDPNEFALLDKLLTPGMVVVDAGANEGFYTVFAARSVGSSGRVWAFEPSAREMEQLTSNVALNGLANVRSFQTALAEQDGQAEILIAADEHSGHNTLGELVYASDLARRETVPLRRLDTLLQENTLERLDFIKIDVEGAEMRVLAGAQQALARFRPFILLEVNDAALRAQGSSQDDLIGHLETQGYRLYLFDPATGLPVPAFEGRYAANMLAVPVERPLPESALLPLPAVV